MYDSNYSYLNNATGFTYNNGYSSNGGTDTAQFYDTAGSDTYFAGTNYAGMFDSADTYSNYATGFAVTHGYSSQGGADTAYLFDTSAAGTTTGGVFVGSGSDAALSGYHYDNIATGFRDVEAYALGNDDIYVNGVNYTLNAHGNWVYD